MITQKNKLPNPNPKLPPSEKVLKYHASSLMLNASTHTVFGLEYYLRGLPIDYSSVEKLLREGVLFCSMLVHASRVSKNTKIGSDQRFKPTESGRLDLLIRTKDQLERKLDSTGYSSIREVAADARGCESVLSKLLDKQQVPREYIERAQKFLTTIGIAYVSEFELHHDDIMHYI